MILAIKLTIIFMNMQNLTYRSGYISQWQSLGRFPSLRIRAKLRDPAHNNAGKFWYKFIIFGEFCNYAVSICYLSNKPFPELSSNFKSNSVECKQHLILMAFFRSLTEIADPSNETESVLTLDLNLK